MSATDNQARKKQMNSMVPQSFHANALSKYQYSPISRKDGPAMIPHAITTAPRSGTLFSKESREIATVTPENEIEITADKKKTRQPRRASTSKQSNNIRNGSSAKGSSLECRTESHTKEIRPVHSSATALYPPYHTTSQPPMTLPKLQQSQGDSTSLASLTVRFVELLNRVSPPFGNGELDLNVAMDNLGVQKRRLYDVTNVLEGIGLIKKENKNNVSWAQQPTQQPSKETESAERQLQWDTEKYRDQSRQLDNYITLVSKRVREYTLLQSTTDDMTGGNSSSLYVTKKEISNLQNYANDTVIAIRAPSGTSLEVPNPDEGMRPGMRRFQIFLTSPADNKSGQVNIFLVQNGGKREKRDNFRQKPEWNDYNTHPRRASSAYPVQALRHEQHNRRNTTVRSNGTTNKLPPPLPIPESLPKYDISPIESKKLTHRPKLKQYMSDKPGLGPRQTSSHSSSSSSTKSRCPLLKRRPSSDLLLVKRDTKTSNDNASTTVKAESDANVDLPLQKRRKYNERAFSPLPSMALQKPKCSPDSKTFSFSEPLTPSKTQKILNQSSFDLLNAPLNSPSAAFLASPAGLLVSPAVTRNGNMQLMGTSILTSSPFRFSPNFQMGDLSPFLPTPTAFRADGRFGTNNEKLDFDDKLSAEALF